MSDTITRHKCVSFTYQITDEAGLLLERIDMPVTYVHGTDGGLLEKVEHAMEGHRSGDVVEVTLSPEEGFGPYDEALIFSDDIENVPPEFRQVGAEVEMQNESGESHMFRISHIGNGKLTVDGNHPFAGKILTFTLHVGEVRDATPEEIMQASTSDRVLQ